MHLSCNNFYYFSFWAEAQNLPLPSAYILAPNQRLFSNIHQNEGNYLQLQVQTSAAAFIQSVPSIHLPPNQLPTTTPTPATSALHRLHRWPYHSSPLFQSHHKFPLLIYIIIGIKLYTDGSRGTILAVRGGERVHVSGWDEKPYEILDNGKKAYLDEADIVTFLDPPKDLIPLDPSSYNPAAYLW